MIKKTLKCLFFSSFFFDQSLHECYILTDLYSVCQKFTHVSLLQTCGINRYLFNRLGIFMHLFHVREGLSSVISVCWASVDWTWSKEWNWCARAYLHLNKKKWKEVRGKSHRHHLWIPQRVISACVLWSGVWHIRQWQLLCGTDTVPVDQCQQHHSQRGTHSDQRWKLHHAGGWRSVPQHISVCLSVCVSLCV